MRIRLDIEYDGTRFCGWQKQSGVVTVQETIEVAIQKVFGDRVSINLYGAGRTDAGVHAINQVAHINIPPNFAFCFDMRKFVMAINFYLLGTETVVKAASVVDDNFHSRFSAIQREYIYLIYNSRSDSVLLKNKAWHIAQPLNLKHMTDASTLFIGTHNFSAFRSSACQARNAVRTIDSMHISRHNDVIIFGFKAKSFLHNQIRIIVGTLKQIGLRKMEKDDIKKLLESGDRRRSGPTAPPYGLYFKDVIYNK